ncbi:hypothetical protein CK203_042229 [Vitis vinifera]|uniref:Uncharacterized protein n=1 Tax=Vitis vinifera TaxID=29760 RepID=A0A438H818_VITVI|nr:hypothetical protein CK203_042229 [Vitis vinifera]
MFQSSEYPTSCKSCYEERGGGPCHHGYGIPHHHHLIRICKASAIIWSQPGRSSFDEGMKLLEVKYMKCTCRQRKTKKLRGRKLIESNQRDTLKGATVS